MFSFLMAHWDWLVAGIAGHVSIKGLTSGVTWVKDKIALIEDFVKASEANVKAVETKVAADAAAVKAALPPVPPVAK